MTKLNNLEDKYWKKLDKIVIFGFGRQGKKMYSTLKRDFDIAAIVDNSLEKQGRQIDEHVILSFDQAVSFLQQYKIIVTTSQYYYQAIRGQLSSIGLNEYVDYIMYQQFVTEWYYKYRNKVNVLKTDISLTTLCTLNCENCMQFLPYWKAGRRKENALEEIKENIDIYFGCVDYLLDLDVVGGEPFLYRNLNEFIRYIGEKYRNRIGYIGFITNGMIVPKEETLELLNKYSMDVSISDYSEDIEYKHQIEELCEKLERYHISYMRNKHIDWFDFGFPKDLYHYEGDDAVQHMQCCNSIEHILDDKKLFYCGLEWSAQKGGLYPIEEKAYVDLVDIREGRVDRKDILEMIMANIEGGCMEFCKVCGGFGIDNNNRVETAKQMPRELRQ
ncbi:radical SAM protein [Acetatifactor aquisgranensis]|uniref:radical SAM protein n=1 Tax=Acetatifactor aquisgranensis TaxID=2941233 RepID=UPI00203C1758|nr:radical SAM protein [Acetatifactor aquisgranensis]